MQTLKDEMRGDIQAAQNQQRSDMQRMIGKMQKLDDDTKAMRIGFRADVHAMSSEVKAEEETGLVEEVKAQSKASNTRITAARTDLPVWSKSWKLMQQNESWC